jgi:hypothetical protein
MRYPVEVKVNIDDGVEAALHALAAARVEPAKRQIWFAEERAGVAAGEASLYRAHVIVRFRCGDGTDDVTVKLRPCLPPRLAARWSRPFEDAWMTYKIEEDWSGERRVFAASAVEERKLGHVLDAVRPGDDAADLLSVDQRDFLRSCAVPEFGPLAVLGPVRSDKFAGLEFGDLDVDMERWRVAGLDFLELSIRVKPKKDETDDAFHARVQRRLDALEQFVRDRGVALSPNRENKTHRVLAALLAGVSPAVHS